MSYKLFFWDVKLSEFDPATHPDYTIFRVLEYGDSAAVQWLRSIFDEAEIVRVLRTERRLSPKSATYWALVYRVPQDQIAALQTHRVNASVQSVDRMKCDLTLASVVAQAQCYDESAWLPLRKPAFLTSLNSSLRPGKAI